MILRDTSTQPITGDSAINAMVQSILGSHRLPEIAKRINDQLAAETALRERFFDEVTESQKAEFINGAVVVHSPAKDRHIEASGNLFTLIKVWAIESGGQVKAEKALCVFHRNAYEPDIAYFGVEKVHLIDGDTLKYPVPDLIVEVLSESTEKIDRGVKFEDYAAHGVKEYWIVDPRDQTLEQYLLAEEGGYQLKVKSSSGEVKSEVLAGFTIPIAAIFEAEAFRAAMGGMR